MPKRARRDEDMERRSRHSRLSTEGRRRLLVIQPAGLWINDATNVSCSYCERNRWPRSLLEQNRRVCRTSFARQVQRIALCVEGSSTLPLYPGDPFPPASSEMTPRCHICSARCPDPEVMGGRCGSDLQFQMNHGRV